MVDRSLEEDLLAGNLVSYSLNCPYDSGLVGNAFSDVMMIDGINQNQSVHGMKVNVTNSLDDGWDG